MSHRPSTGQEVCWCYFYFYFIFLVARHSLWDLSSSDQGLNPVPQQWKRWVLTIGLPGNSPVGATFKRMHYVFCVHGSLPGDYILEQFVHFLGKKKNGSVLCKSFRKEKSQHFLLESSFTQFCNILCRWITQGDFGGVQDKTEGLNAIITLNNGGLPIRSFRERHRVLIQFCCEVLCLSMNSKQKTSWKHLEDAGAEAFSETSGIGRLLSLKM